MKKLNVYTVDLWAMGIIFKDVMEDGHRVTYACGQDSGRFQGLQGKGRSSQEAFDDLRQKAEEDIYGA